MERRTVPRPKREFLDALTSIRFFAALIVLLFHATEKIADHLPPVIGPIIRNGAIGVPLFFILSGFVLTYSYQGSPLQLTQFFIARFARIYPVYLASLIIAFPFILKPLKAANELSRIPELVALKLSLLHGWSPWATWIWNVPSWSLSFEAFFYLLFPLLLPLVGKLNSPIRLALVPVCSLIFAYCVPFKDLLQPNISLAPIRDSLLFVIGVALAYEFIQGRRMPKLIFAFSVLGALSLLAIHHPFPAGGPIRVALLLCLAGVIMGAASINRADKNFLNNPTLKFLGESSYSLYILHIPIGAFIALIASRFNSGFESPFVITIFVIISIAISCVAYTYLEVPANRYLRAKLAGKRSTATYSS